MAPGWETMRAATGGSRELRTLRAAERYLPQEPKEPEDAHLARIQRSVLAPLTTRVLEASAGLVLRRPIAIEAATTSDQEFWDDFAKNVDGTGSDLSMFARQLFIAGLRDGHAITLVDAPAESEEGKPYFVLYKAPQIYGWQSEGTSQESKLSQIRLHSDDYVKKDEYTEQLIQQVHVIYQNRYEIHTHGLPAGSAKSDFQEGPLTFDRVPIAIFNTNKLGLLLSSPLLIDVADLNLSHYACYADRMHALHLAAMQKLILEGYEEDESNLGVNYALRLPIGGKAYWLTADAGSFTAQRELVQDLEQLIVNTAITKLAGAKQVAESEGAKRMDQVQSNSILSVLSMEMENCLNQSFELVSQLVKRKPPKVIIDRDFDFYRLLGQDMAVLATMQEKGQLTTELFVDTMRRGEVLKPDINVEETAAAIDTIQKEKQQQAMDLAAASRPLPPAGQQSVGSNPANPRPRTRPDQVRSSGSSSRQAAGR
jgi:hypothetical protein